VKVAGVVLVGGKSTRMGAPKAMLPFGPERMIERVLRLLGRATDRRVVVAAVGQVLPDLPAAVQVVRDQRPERGPLEGIRAGLQALEGHCDAAYVTACDVPTIQADFIRFLVRRLEGYRIAVPRDGAHDHPLAAVYRIDVLPEVQSLLDADRLRPAYLFDAVPTCRVSVDELRSVDPDLDSLQNLNCPEDYFAALARCGLDVDQQTRRMLSERNADGGGTIPR